MGVRDCAANLRLFRFVSEVPGAIEGEHLLQAVGEPTLEWVSSDIALFEVRKRPEERRGMRELLYQGAIGRVSPRLT